MSEIECQGTVSMAADTTPAEIIAKLCDDMTASPVDGVTVIDRGQLEVLSVALKPPPQDRVVARWLPIGKADRTINHVTDFTQIGLTLKNSDTFWVRDEDGRIYQAAWSEGNNGRDYWWDWEAESPVDPVEFMPHPLDPRFPAAASEGSAE